MLSIGSFGRRGLMNNKRHSKLHTNAQLSRTLNCSSHWHVYVIIRLAGGDNHTNLLVAGNNMFIPQKTYITNGARHEKFCPWCLRSGPKALKPYSCST